MSYDSFLRTALSRYSHADMTRTEIMRAVKAFKDLKPTNTTYVSNDGNSSEYVSLSGTIPVMYKGKTYNIPLCIYLRESYPYNPPFILVRPTPTMQIRPGKHVDNAGLVYLPYLHEWSYPRSDLQGLIQILRMIFGEEPPVFSKPQPPTPSALPYPINSSMPMPGLPQPPQSNYYPPFYPPRPAPPVQTGTLKLSEVERKFYMMSAVEDKIKLRLKEVLSQSQAEMDALRTTQEDLERGKGKLQSMISKINNQQEKLEEDIRKMKTEEQSIAGALDKIKLAEQLDIDDVISPTAPIYKQILDAFSEEQAIDDAIYYLSEALRKDVIDLEVFLKQVRELSRKQFLLRMIINKCRQKASLSDIY